MPAPPTEAVAPSWWASRVGGLPGAFWALWSGSLVNRLGQFVLPFLSLFLTHSRGYSVALVERDDFGQGTSSRSSKMVHGGLRY